MSFIRFSNQDIVNDTAKITTSTWTNNTNELTSAHLTSSTQATFGSPTSSGAHYIEVYNADASVSTSEVQYSVAYGHRGGSGSLNFTHAVGSHGKSPSRNIYSQYRQLVFGTETQNFNFTDRTPDDIYVININRSRYKHNLKPGSLNLKVGNLLLTDDSIAAPNAEVVEGELDAPADVTAEVKGAKKAQAAEDKKTTEAKKKAATKTQPPKKGETRFDFGVTEQREGNTVEVTDRAGKKKTIKSEGGKFVVSARASR